jgi:hypothetical protein
MRTILTVLACFLLIGFIPISCCKNQSAPNGKIDIIRFRYINYLTDLNTLDSIKSQLNYDTITNTDTLYIFVQMDMKQIACNAFNFSFTNTSYAGNCNPITPATYELGNKITSIELESDTTYNGNNKGVNLLNLIVEDGILLKDKMNNSKNYFSSLIFKIKSKPMDVYKHQ